MNLRKCIFQMLLIYKSSFIIKMGGGSIHTIHVPDNVKQEKLNGDFYLWNLLFF